MRNVWRDNVSFNPLIIIKLKTMKKFFFLLLIIGLVSMSFKNNSANTKLTEGIVLVQGEETGDEAYISTDDLVYDEGDFAEQAVNGRTAEGELNGSAVEICPGKGVRCRVIIVYDNEVVAYSGWKKAGSKDVVVSFD